jgi:hypothetical protein
MLIDEGDKGTVKRVSRVDFVAAVDKTARRTGAQATATSRDNATMGTDEPVAVSNVELLVELRGLEPLTPSLRTRCATSCATAPEAPSGAATRLPARERCPVRLR